MHNVICSLLLDDHRSFSDDREFLVYFERLALNMYRRYVRRENRFLSWMNDDIEAVATGDAGWSDPEAILAEKETREELEAAIRKLKAGPREAAAAEILEGKAIAEIAAQLKKSRSTVRKYLKIAHHKLREELAPDGELSGAVLFETSAHPAEEENG